MQLTELQTRSREFLELISAYDHAIIVMHDNPDPDAIASGWALRQLLEDKLSLDARLIAGGEIVRAENRHMVNLLEPPIELIEELEFSEGTAFILVDCGLGAGNHLLMAAGVDATAVIDHHPLLTKCPKARFCDVRPDVAASASIVAEYLQDERVDVGVKLATALAYAMRTETQGQQTHHSDLDRCMLPWIIERADPELLAEIENAPLPNDYFGDLVLALQNTFLYDDAAFCLLPRAHGPEIVGEVADLLIRNEEVHRVLCGAAWNGNVVVSARTDQEDDDAAVLLQAALNGYGHCGGHLHRAGGKIIGSGTGGKIAQKMEDELRTLWLHACGVDRQRGTRLVALREITENL